jgi:hypothetical protein
MDMDLWMKTAHEDTGSLQSHLDSVLKDVEIVQGMKGLGEREACRILANGLKQTLYYLQLQLVRNTPLAELSPAVNENYKDKVRKFFRKGTPEAGYSIVWWYAGTQSFNVLLSPNQAGDQSDGQVKEIDSAIFDNCWSPLLLANGKPFKDHNCLKLGAAISFNWGGSTYYDRV